MTLWHRRGPEVRPVTLRGAPIERGNEVRVKGGKHLGAFAVVVAMRKDGGAALMESAALGQAWISINQLERIRWADTKFRRLRSAPPATTKRR